MFHFLSLELMVVVVVIMVYTRFRKSTIFSLAMVKGLTIYMPPSQTDFDMLQESLKEPTQRTTMKGKKNKFDSRKAKSAAQLKFPLRQMEMGTELLQYCNKYFGDFDFLLMLFHYSALMFASLLIMKMFVPTEFTQTNLTLYMAGITLLLIFKDMTKNSFPTGYT